MTEITKRLVRLLLLRFSYVFEDTYTEYDEEVYDYQWNGEVFHIARVDKGVVDELIKRITEGDGDSGNI